MSVTIQAPVIYQELFTELLYILVTIAVHFHIAEV